MSITVSAKSLLSVVAPFIEKGLTYTPQSAWVQISGAKGRKVYIQKRDNVALIKLSGFTMDHPGLEADPKPETNMIKQRLVMSSLEDVQTTLADVLEHLLTLSARPAIPRGTSSSVASAPKTDWTLPTTQRNLEA